MAKFVCGGTEHDVPEMNFLAVERAWPFVLKATEEFDPLKGSAAAIGVVAAAMFEGENFDRATWDLAPELPEDKAFEQLIYTIKKRLKVGEVGNAKDAMYQILLEAGLDVNEGELQALLARAMVEDPTSPATALATLQNSLQQE